MEFEVDDRHETKHHANMHCHKYIKLERAALQSTTYFEPCLSNLERKMEGKDASNSKMSSTTAIILALATTPRDYLLYIQLQR